VAEAVAAVLSEPTYRAGARKVAAEITALPSPEQVAEQLTTALT
jgi:UDP:flavonoid glycosyltransferase YjiC (YdhE family)